MFIAGLVKMLPVPRTTTWAREAARPAPAANSTTEETNCYDQLIHSLFRPAEQCEQESKVVAFTSASAGAGTSFVLREIAEELACYADKRVLVIEAQKLQSCAKAELEKWLRLCAATGGNLSFFSAENERNGNGKFPAALSKAQKKAMARRSKAISLEENLRLLSKHFDYVLVDCPSIKDSSEPVLLARLVQGVVIVAAAGQTRREDIQRSQRVIEIAEGKVLGFVLNKRKYPIPNWLYRRI